MMETSIGIIGAGIAGLSAAHKLYKNGFNNVIVFEATDRIGGRIHTVPFELGVIELGAQWLHGQHDNQLYEIAKQRDLLSDPESDFGTEGVGLFCTDTGEELSNETVGVIVSYLDKIKEQMSETYVKSLYSDQIISAQKIFSNSFENYINSNDCPVLRMPLLWSIFEWYMKFEMIDNSCDDMNDISLLSYSEWRDCDGVELINFKHGYQTMINSLLNEIPRHFIVVEKPVKRIELSDDNSKVRLFIEEENQIEINHLIITSSIGFMKNNINTFFGFPLSDEKISLIKSLGFGTIDKIYLYFESPFWKSDDKGFQLIWTKRDHQFPQWVYDISGFDLVREQPKVLVAWIGGNGAQDMEKVESDQLIGNICAQILRLFLNNIDIENPSKVIRSKWSTNKYFCGSYSNRSINYEKLKCDIECLSEPILIEKQMNYSKELIDYPLVLFAGEATDKQYYSTTHGAYRSGLREADRLIEFYKYMQSLEKNIS